MREISYLEKRYKASEEVVAREIEGEIIIIPLSSEIGDLEDELYTLNKTAYSFWKKVDGKKTLADIISELDGEYEVEPNAMQEDICGLVEELAKRKILVEI
jgi:hypothetical protein